MKKMKKRIAVWIATLLLLLNVCGCEMLSEESIKLRDLDFTVQGEDVIEEELKSIIEEKKECPFKLTYSDNQNLYICIGYGKQDTGGYSIVVNDLYLTEEAIYVNTELLGPEQGKPVSETPSYPYIVLKTEYLDKTVIFK